MLDFLRRRDDIAPTSGDSLNESHHADWPTYYTRELADRIYRAYECDFDRFGYARAIA